MKAIWKVLIGAAAVAAVTPYKVEKDEETGAVKVTSVTWSATYNKNEDGKNLVVNLLPAFIKRDGEDECQDECCCCGEETEDDGITIDVDVDPGESEAEAEAEVETEAEPEE